MPRWHWQFLTIFTLVGATGCLSSDPRYHEDENAFDDENAYDSCDDCHLAVPPAVAPHDGNHRFLSCNEKNCHGDVLNSDGSMASKTSKKHTNEKLDASCFNCHLPDEEDVEMDID